MLVKPSFTKKIFSLGSKKHEYYVSVHWNSRHSQKEFRVDGWFLCFQCKHDFCWVCLEQWKRHNSSTGGYFKCNRYEAVKKVEEQAAELVTDVCWNFVAVAFVCWNAVLAFCMLKCCTGILYVKMLYKHFVCWNAVLAFCMLKCCVSILYVKMLY